MSLTARKQTLEFPRSRTRSAAPDTLSDILVKQGHVSPGDMLKAVALQNHEKTKLTEVLQGLGFAQEDVLLEAVAEQTALPIVDLRRDPPARVLAHLVPPTLGLTHRFVIWKHVENVLVVALSDPGDQDKVKALLHDVAPAIQFVLASLSSILAHYETNHRAELSAAANTCVPAGLSCRTWAGRKPRVIGAMLAAALVVSALLVPATLIAFICGWIMLALVANGLFKVFMFTTQLGRPPQSAPLRRPARLPKFSILLPLLREKDIVDRLVQRMSALSYPKELLEIVLIYEENDEDTRAHLQSKRLPYWAKKLEVPADTLQTKPRAMNYALDFCNGDIIGIYDAEDAPEPRQLYTVAQRFENADETVACIQCQLDYYNAGTNWISRCFTIEYAILFRVILPGLERWNLPVPLGGTSVFFRRDILEDLGRWDAQNVTEDADLGIRLRRKGYRCLWANATTYEEANFRILPWVRQRSRWLKGFMQTWITHMRNPVKTLHELGFFGFLVFQIQMLGTFTSFAAVPIVLPLWLYSFGFSLPVYDSLPTLMFSTLIGGFLMTEGFLLLLGAFAVYRRGGKGLWLYLPTMLLYWPLGAFAAYKALWELFVHPTYWDKTPHGINDTDYQGEIDRLTAAPEDSEKTYSPASFTGIGG